MKIEKGRKGGGSKLTRTQTVTVRLDPKLRYLAELAARKHRRTVSSFVEWAVEESLSKVILKEGDSQEDIAEINAADEAERLWDVDEPDRLAKLAFSYPEMLNHEEQLLWKLAKESDFLWRGSRTIAGGRDWKFEEANFQFSNFRMCWEDFLEVVRGNVEAARLPDKYSERLIKSASRNKART
jgi:uncharacterized protein (DUF1778 family)